MSDYKPYSTKWREGQNKLLGKTGTIQTEIDGCMVFLLMLLCIAGLIILGINAG